MTTHTNAKYLTGRLTLIQNSKMSDFKIKNMANFLVGRAFCCPSYILGQQNATPQNE